MNVQWIFPDCSTWEMNVSSISQLLFALEAVDSVRVEDLPYKVARKELIMKDNQMFVAISLLAQKVED